MYQKVITINFKISKNLDFSLIDKVYVLSMELVKKN